MLIFSSIKATFTEYPPFWFDFVEIFVKIFVKIRSKRVILTYLLWFGSSANLERFSTSHFSSFSSKKLSKKKSILFPFNKGSFFCGIPMTSIEKSIITLSHGCVVLTILIDIIPEKKSARKYNDSHKHSFCHRFPRIPFLRGSKRRWRRIFLGNFVFIPMRNEKKAPRMHKTLPSQFGNYTSIQGRLSNLFTFDTHTSEAMTNWANLIRIINFVIDCNQSTDYCQIFNKKKNMQKFVEVNGK